MSTSLYDAIVIGAGPAGNTAALKLSEMGYRVVVIDWRQSIGDKLCTGIIGNECVERFPPEAEHVYQKARAATIVSPSGKRYRIARDETQAFIIDRVAYVDSLARHAMEAGAGYELGERVANIEVSDQWVAVQTERGAMNRFYRAQLVILANGFGSPLVNMVGLQSDTSRDYMVGCQAEVVADDLKDAEVYLGEEIAPGSFGWLVPLSGSRALAGIVSRGKLNGHMGGFLSTLQGKGKVTEVISSPRRWGIPLRPLSRTYGDRVLVVGDAAGLVKPTTGGGIYYALLSGEIAAKTANEAFIANDVSSRQLRRYEKEWKAVFGGELGIGYAARMLYEALGDRQIERLLGELVNYEIRDDLINSKEFSFDWHSRVILKAVGHRQFGRVFTSFGPKVAPFLSRLISMRPAREEAPV